MWHDDYAGLMNLLCSPIVHAIIGVICRHYIIPLLFEKFDNLVSDTSVGISANMEWTPWIIQVLFSNCLHF